MDDDELDWGGPGAEEKGTEMTVVVVRRRGLGIYRVGSRMTPVKVSYMEVPTRVDVRKYHCHLDLYTLP